GRRAGARGAQARASGSARLARPRAGRRAGAVAGARAAARGMGQLSPAVDDVSALFGEHPLAFEHPAWLLLLFVIPALWLFARGSLADFSPGQLRLQALLRTLVVAGTAVA